MVLKEEEEKRYSRQLSLPEIGSDGQLRLKQGKVLIIGVGGLGSPIALYLTAAGVGNIGLMDSDMVDISNLQRQIIHTTADIGKFKVYSAKEKLKCLNKNVKVTAIPEMFNHTNANIIEDYDIIVDATDNFNSKFFINDVCVSVGKPYSYGGILQYQGQVMTHIPQSACFRCLFESMPIATTSIIGPLGVIPGIIGTIQAAEVIKYILGIGDLLTNRLLTFDALSMSFNMVSVPRHKDCPKCHLHETVQNYH